MQIYLARNNQQAGPYTVEQLNQMLASQQVLLTDLIWHIGMTEWKTVGEVTQGQSYYYPEAPQTAEAAPASTPFNPVPEQNTTTAKIAIEKKPAALAPLSKRAFAKFIDLCLWIPAGLFSTAFMSAEQKAQVAKLQGEIFTLIGQDKVDQANQLSYEVLALVPQSVWLAMAGYILAMLVLQAILLHKTGQSIGKKVLGIQIVDATTKVPVNITRSFLLRSICFIILNYFITPIFSLIDWVFAFGKKRQALHDRLARTVVIDKK
ncbi:RDD family protein [Acinetobacter populi]|uniref:RDD family protein n=1 Tax=Acinetobacter populi TaxID=1582270 RepID=A0A1Z9YV35_9GAMM|nr:RDD family protein [Acinetobacter populi]OUY06106.1 hypothetical protein CAP51_14390 [Acinetobacter populi]